MYLLNGFKFSEILLRFIQKAAFHIENRISFLQQIFISFHEMDLLIALNHPLREAQSR